jgi:anti-anti-sigma factor
MTVQHEKQSTIDISLEETENLRLSLEETGIEGTVILRISGLIDTYNSDFFRNQAYRVVDAGNRNIIIDASSATFMSSTGIGAFTALLKKIKESDGVLIIFGMPARIYDVFKLLGFTTFFRFCETRKDALNMLDVDTGPEDVFPVLFSCPVCYRKLKAVRSGRFRCSSCKVVLSVDSRGEVLLG